MKSNQKTKIILFIFSVSCGGHEATNCFECDQTYADWCNGDCSLCNGQCVLKTNSNCSFNGEWQKPKFYRISGTPGIHRIHGFQMFPGVPRSPGPGIRGHFYWDHNAFGGPTLTLGARRTPTIIKYKYIEQLPKRE